MAVGTGIAAVCVLGVVVFDALTHGNPAAPTLAIPILAAGSLGGWLLGPTAWASQRRRDWVASAVILAIATVGIGDAVIVAGLILGSPPTANGQVSWPAGISLVAGVVEIFILGLLFGGWFALPFTLAASAIWAAVMCRLRGRMDPIAPRAPIA